MRSFLRHGFTGSTVTNIEAAASLSPGSGSFYLHFRSKEDVFTAAIEREAEWAAAASNADIDPGTVEVLRRHQALQASEHSAHGVRLRADHGNVSFSTLLTNPL